MPTNRQRRTRHPDPAVSETVRYFFTGKGKPDKLELFILRGNLEKVKAAWETIRDEVMPTWIADHPCTRHSAWWSFNSTEQRRRLGGTGDTHYDHYEPSECSYGIPTDWVSEWEVENYNGRSVDIHGKKTNEKWPPGSGYYQEGDFTGVAIDPKDPPVFESEAAFLQRHNLLTPQEKKYLAGHPEAMEPERIEFDGQEED